MYRLILFMMFLIGAININGQEFVPIKENGLMKNAQAYGALLCPLNKNKADKILKKVIELNITNKHINGYCEARAHFLSNKISSLITENGCSVGKIWAFAPSLYTMVWDKKLKAENPLFKGENVTWGYHVAPLIAIENGSKTDTVVVDFSIKNKAFIPYKEWLKKLNCPEAIYLFTDHNYYLFNTFNGLILTGDNYNNFKTPDSFPQIITGHFYYLLNNDTLTVPTGLSYNDLAIHLIEKYYSDPRYSSYKLQIKDLVEKNEGMGNLVNRSLNNLPSDLIEDCIKFFNERLEYWKKQ